MADLKRGGESGEQVRGSDGKAAGPDGPDGARPEESGEKIPAAGILGRRAGKPPRERALKALIGRSFHRTLLLSALAALLTWALALTAFYLWGSLRPANYYESRIPQIAERVRRLDDPLSPVSRGAVEDMIPLEGMGYQIIDSSGRTVYGSFEASGDAEVRDAADLLRRLNTHVSSDGFYIRYEPLTGPDGSFAGALALRYKLTVASANPAFGLVIGLGGLLMAAAPFGYLYLFTYLEGRRLSRRLEEPFDRLIAAAEQIREHDLDFSLESGGTGVRELNQLLAAFEQMREALQESLRREWELERERRDLTAAVAHDLGTPLSVILGHAEVMLEDAGRRPERAERYAATILGAARRCIRLTEDLSEAARVERPDFTLSPEPVDLEAAVRAKGREYAFLCRQRGVTFALEARDLRAERERGPLRLDQHRINRVLDNLVSNALRYAPEGGSVALSLRIRPGEAEFEVRDSGPGFAEAGGGRIFEKFYREDAARAAGDFVRGAGSAGRGASGSGNAPGSGSAGSGSLAGGPGAASGSAPPAAAAAGAIPAGGASDGAVSKSGGPAPGEPPASAPAGAPLPYSSGDRSRSGHSGLGLFIARTIVNRHGGGIAARNLPEGGACLRFTVAELD
ncbi:sensor histidine kinase [Saccharibacillus sp. CPCC 101409]|uniref:sensor histidine kinase n=1 Tax=Saccharibacillus sp. CPCC 101409 TaxID=3058041 RepID=UPI00267227DB|nr:sensor histidine kinase [Saccharibacillus sp. CPCC 101409]MDO3410106.1 sensor histidine kinase [Saccharibacillus sp. CPCC 101409]